MNLRDLVERGIERLTLRGPVEVELGDPVTDADVTRVQDALGFALDPAFVDLFRSVNGFRVRTERTLAHVRPLADLFLGRSVFFPPGGPGRTPFLGGLERAALFDGLRVLGRPTDLDPDGYEVIALFADAAHPDPVAVLVRDHGADATDHRPVCARDLVILLAMALDLREVRAQGWFDAQGFAGNHPLVALDLAGLDPVTIVEGPPDDPDLDRQLQWLAHLRGAVGLRGAPEVRAPVRWSCASTATNRPAADVLADLRTALPDAEIESGHDQVSLEFPGTDVSIVVRWPVPKGPKKSAHAPSTHDLPVGALARTVELHWSSASPEATLHRVRAAVGQLATLET